MVDTVWGYSDNEIKLLSHFLPSFYYIKVSGSISPAMAYGFAANEAFVRPDKYKKNYITALRQCCILLETSQRGTKEFAELIEDFTND